ncbi:MAG: hypothetical protein F3745_08020 [Nitrospinae bacterium]|nr:hypothetical protein [Nitrospinota bacterium]
MTAITGNGFTELPVIAGTRYKQVLNCMESPRRELGLRSFDKPQDNSGESSNTLAAVYLRNRQR